MSAEHTPGPWFVDEDGVVCDRQTNVSIPHAHGMVEYAYRVSFDRSTPEAMANARLIAAAPELLEALLRLLSENDNMTQRINLLGACEQARAAIAKATGGAA